VDRLDDCCPLASVSKTRTALTLCELMIKKNPNTKILIVVPTEIIKNQ
jgi:hypothetical protein